MTPEQIQKQIGDLVGKVEAARADLDAFRELVAENYAPHKPGDEIVINDFSYRGRKMMVNRVALGIRGGIRKHEVKTENMQLTWCFYGLLIKKDGEPGVVKVSSTLPIISEKVNN